MVLSYYSECTVFTSTYVDLEWEDSTVGKLAGLNVSIKRSGLLKMASASLAALVHGCYRSGSFGNLFFRMRSSAWYFSGR